MPTVLVVDDEAGVRQVLSRLLRRQNYKVITAADAYAAMGAAKREKPDLILLDVMIPPMDGLTFLMLLRQEPAGRQIPVILLTGLCDANTVSRAREFGVCKHLLKGEYTPEALLAAITEHLGE